MQVKDLKKLLEEAEDNAIVIIPLNPSEGFDGAFFSPCVEESGYAEFGEEYIDEEDLAEMKLLDKEEKKEKSFVLVPCGFFDNEAHEKKALN